MEASRRDRARGKSGETSEAVLTVSADGGGVEMRTTTMVVAMVVVVVVV